MRAAVPSPRRAGRILVSLFVFLAAGITTAGYLGYRSYERHFRVEVERHLSTVADLKVGDLAQWRRERLGNGSVFLGNAAFSNLVGRWFAAPEDSGARAQITGWLHEVQTAYQYDQVILLDARGVPRVSVPQTAEPPGAHASRSALEVLRSGRVGFLDLNRDRPGGPVHLTVLAPIVEGTEHPRPLGVILLRIDPEQYLYPFLHRWPIASRTAETLLVRRDGNDVLFLSPLRFRKDSALTFREPLSRTNLPAVKAVLGQEGVEEGIDYRGVPVLAAVRVVPDSPWSLVARMDATEAYAPLRERRWMLVALVGFTLVAAGATFGFVWREQELGSARERYRAAEVQRDSEQRYRVLFDNMLEGFAHCRIVRDEQGRPVDFVYLDVNGAFERLTGLKDVVGRLVSEVIPGLRESDPGLLEIYGRVASTGRPERFETYVSPLRTWLAISAYCPRTEHFVTVFEVVTGRKEAEEGIRQLNAELELRVRERTAELAAANQELEAFSYSVSHDLRAPLRHIDGFVGLLLDRCRADLTDQGRHYADTIADSARQMGRLIDELLQFSRNGRAEMHQAGVDMNRLLRETLDSLAPDLAGRRIEWVIGNLPPSTGDGAMLRLVWRNLLANAVKYTRAKDRARIEVAAHEWPGETIFVVRDDGVGFDMRYAHKLFGVFQRLHSEAEFEGTGIGLATVRRIVSRHGGRTWAEGEPGEGAAFYFSLPRSGGEGPCPS
jgi:signal transduction histidine kinase